MSKKIYHIKMDAKQPETQTFEIELTPSEIRKLSSFADATQKDSIQTIIFKAIQKISNINYNKYNYAK
jgi:hypothetical protein